jgi:hypothetical protein
MAVETHILSTAAELVARARHRHDALCEELERLDRRRSELEAELEAARKKAQRLANFKAHDGAVYLCPQCWIDEESPAPLTLRKGGEWRDEFFICELCTLEIRLAE